MGPGANLGAAVRTFFSCEGLLYYLPEVSVMLLGAFTYEINSS